ncbi:unnamed protein product [Cercopithifilaria johnstoni]|uniref:Uncharacterized protein n=1 Tax=Cercopithifilaria johnstoni TaxID=2874296 RepID=A0A8J2Q415_9BILA|nr:unnamed protein product [Cercopithifilaria johnstoni]
MTAVRDSLCNMEPVQIPRPQISGLQFIPTRGRLGFYASIRRDGEKYGVEIKPIGPRRPLLSDGLFVNDSNIPKSSNSRTDEAEKKQNDSESVKVSNSSATTPTSSFPVSDYERINLNKQ